MTLVTSRDDEEVETGLPDRHSLETWGREGTKTVAISPGARPLDVEGPHATGEAIDPRGRFRVEAALAQGGMGVIYRAWDAVLNRPVALKVLLEAHAGDPGMERRFLDEATLTASLQHPGVVPVFEIGRCIDRRPFFAMGLVEGETLAQVLSRREECRELANLLRPFEQICQAMGHAHARGVIHRDLKPENVMMGDFGTVKVIDWGIATRVDANGNDAGEGDDAEGELIFGTPAYLPPEQAKGDRHVIDARADVFSLGAILSEMLTGLPPYTGGSQDEVLERARTADLGEVMTRLEHCGAERELVALAQRCLSPRVEDRPRHGGEVGQVIKDHLESGLRRFERDQIRFFELSLEMFCIADLDGYFRQVNANFPRILGYTEGELLARPFLDFVHPEDVEPTLQAMAKLREGGQVCGFTNRYRHAAGHCVLLEWSARAVPEERVIYAVARPVP